MIARARTVDGSEPGETRPLLRRLGFLALAVMVALSFALVLPALGDADSLYWSHSSTGQLWTSNVNGTGASMLFSGLQEPAGIALDPAAGLIYWAEPGQWRIEVGNLNGTGTPKTLYARGAGRPVDVAIDAAAGKLYWTDEISGRIMEGTTAGGGTPNVLYTEPHQPNVFAEPAGIAIDSAAGKLYWTDEGTGEIEEGALGGTSEKTLHGGGGGYSNRPNGIAVASSTSTLYWTEAGNAKVPEEHGPGGPTTYGISKGAVTYSPLGASNDARTAYTEPTPRGTARAGARRRDRGALLGGLRSLCAANGLTASGSAQSLFSSAPTSAYPAVLAAPKGEGAPEITGSPAIGATLKCATGSWALNAPGASFYQAPQTYAYQWQLNGTNIAGAQSSTFSPSSEGSYTCLVTATNAAGSATQSSAATVVKAGPPTVSIVSPVSGGTYEQGQVVPTSFSCAEAAGGPGLASCTGSGDASAPSGHLNTSTAGTLTYTVTAVSKNGQRATASTNYIVIAKKRAPPTIAIASSCAQVRGRTTTHTLACGGAAACRGVLSLTYITTMPTHASKHATQVVLARTRYSLAPRKKGSVSVKISPQAQTLLLKARDRHLTVSAQATVSGGATRQRSVVLRFR